MPAKARSKAAVAEPEAPKAPDHEALIEHLLSLEDLVRETAHDYPAGDNTDAIKSALRNVDAGIGHLRKALDQIRRWDRG